MREMALSGGEAEEGFASANWEGKELEAGHWSLGASCVR